MPTSSVKPIIDAVPAAYIKAPDVLSGESAVHTSCIRSRMRHSYCTEAHAMAMSDVLARHEVISERLCCRRAEAIPGVPSDDTLLACVLVSAN